jgi:hypothetical protein
MFDTLQEFAGEGSSSSNNVNNNNNNNNNNNVPPVATAQQFVAMQAYELSSTISFAVVLP